MIEWFSQVLCWKHEGIIDSSTVANAYVWLTAHISDVAGYASCNTNHIATI
ncbi:hypothetical protein AAA799E16_00280 [Marine Group I thaumarchaeote SCGC AAA799-E16]|uniref:Uncharacterized protein n=2 Tax=Marine Group I TaxID=905826 RepID=A0A087RQJ8_9ARCH|nr:hypothetical protein AAA799E16_00280 [Marine Group I thaumarchaeote SCGC AAA799-E16]KFM15752.1 hypothetical protein SCCGRSA3_02591 [Marine Group I thaumarchaeote SCGC RSA3]